MKLSGERQAGGGRPGNNRSVVTNRTKFFPRGIDGRTADGRRWKDLLVSFLDHLGGIEGATDYQLGQARDLASIKLALEKEQANQIAGEPFDLAVYANAAAIFRSIARDLGLHGGANPKKTRLSDGLRL